MNLFSYLQQIKSFEFISSSKGKSQTGWNGSGNGTVSTKIKQGCILFKEDGFFKLDISSQQTKISNEYIWKQISPNKIKLSHARFGYENTVTLFNLIKISETIWQSEEAHVCVDDLYSAKLEITSNAIKLEWDIVGPKKDECIEYIYSF
ncbi:hypothetical protein FLM55_07565 [Francisella sp. Scap27]|uniref:DUF6314 family protein n=1 Tax=Francisella sp. Scap27 TaxID=2589986 RepID=UPI0015BF56CA|nr:DUF6314 family protein [Francisella sp. Scap27]QLE79598.1 hypothetical protein FLM55_07565 [Francisella sp. Scap27]